MPRRPEIGNVQLYPNRPLRESDKNGYVLRFYCPIRRQRIRRNCGTRDRREARRIMRECQKRLINGVYVSSGGAITDQHELRIPRGVPVQTEPGADTTKLSWDEAYDLYRQNRSTRVRPGSLVHALSRLDLTEKEESTHGDSIGRLPQGVEREVPSDPEESEPPQRDADRPSHLDVSGRGPIRCRGS